VWGLCLGWTRLDWALVVMMMMRRLLVGVGFGVVRGADDVHAADAAEDFHNVTMFIHNVTLDGVAADYTPCLYRSCRMYVCMYLTHPLYPLTPPL
jgi:hypothetical protein